jgi:DNA-directed RNA polymerase beta' subunit
MRKITPREINYLLDFINPSGDIPKDTATSISRNIRLSLVNQLKDKLIHPSILSKLKSELKKHYYESMIQAGESVGVICAQSIGEKQTQNTLNSFHVIGTSEKTTTQGVPRFKELINAIHKPKNVNHTIYFTCNTESIESLRANISHSIIGLLVSDIIDTSDILLNKTADPWHDAFMALHEPYEEFEYKHCITLKLNRKKLYEYRLTLKDIGDVISSEYEDVLCIWSPIQYAQIDVYVNTTNIKLPNNRLLYINTENADYIYLEECVLPIIEKMYVCGIPSITDIFYVKDKDTSEWYVETNGWVSSSCFKTVLSHPLVDYVRTVSNNIWDIYVVLGIEATREFLINEFTSIMDDINICHVLLLVDRMTYSGIISPITRHTLRKDDNGVMSKVSFEESLENFLNAAAQGETDPIKSISSAIMCGKRAHIGTGMCNLKLDIASLPSIVNETKVDTDELVFDDC